MNTTTCTANNTNQNKQGLEITFENEIVSHHEDGNTERRNVERHLDNLTKITLESYDYEDPCDIDLDDRFDYQGREYYRIPDFLDSMRLLFTGRCRNVNSTPYTTNAFALLNPYKNAAFPENADYFLKLIQDVGMLTYDLTNANCKSEYIRAISVFVMLRTKGPIFNCKFLFAIKDKFFELFGDFSPESDGLFSNLRGFLDAYSRMKDSALFKKLYKFIMYILSLSIFEKIGLSFKNLRYSKIQEEAVKKKFYLGPDFIHCILDTITFICQRGYQCMVTGSLDPLYHSGKSYEEWFTISNRLKRESVCLSNPAAHGINLFKFKSELDEAIDKGKCILKYAPVAEAAERKFIMSELHALEMIKCDLITKAAAGKERVPPWSALLNAPPGNGKSSFTSIMFYYYASLFDLPNGSEFKYTRNCFDKHWSAFTSVQWFGILDDIAALHPNKSPTVDPSLAELIQIVNQVALVPPQAELADKGKTPVLFKALICTTNTENLNAYAYFACPLAVQRRLPWIIRILAKPEYAKHEIMLDSDKVPPVVPGEFPNYWNISVLRVVPATNAIECKHARTELVAEYSDINDFLRWYGQTVVDYERKESAVLHCSENMSTIVICKICYRAEKICVCQSSEEDIDMEQFDSGIINEDDTVSIETNEIDDSLASSVISEEEAIFDEETGDSVSPESRSSFAYWIRKMDNYFKGTPQVSPLPPHSDEIIYNEFGHAFIRNYDRMFERVPLYDQPTGCEGMEENASWYAEQTAAGAWVNKRYAKFFATYWIEFFAYVYLEWQCFWKYTGWIYRFPYLGKYIQRWTTAKTKDSRVMMCIIRRMGEKVERRIGKVPLLLSITAVAATSGLMIVGIVQFFKWLTKKEPVKAKTQSTDSLSAKIGVIPNIKPDARPNIYYNDIYETTVFDVSPQTTSLATCTLEDRLILENTFRRNCVYLKSHWVDSNGVSLVRPNAAVCLAGHVYIVNSHGIPLCDTFNLEVIQSNKTHGISNNLFIPVSQTRFFRIPDTDYCFFLLSELPPKKTIVNYFCKDALRGILSGKYIGINGEGENFDRILHNIHHVSQQPLGANCIEAWEAKADVPTNVGDCGSLMFSWTDFGPILLGIHAGGSGADRGVLSIVVNQSVIALGLSLFDKQVSGGTPVLSMPNFAPTLGPLNKKSPVRFIEEGTAEVYGTFDGFRATPKSRVQATFIQDQMIDAGYEVKYGPPQMKGWKPWYLALDQMVKPVTKFNVDIFNECVRAFTNDVLHGLSRADLDEIKPLDDFSTINGVAGVAYLDAINKTTSMGFPIKQSKKKFLVTLPKQRGFDEPVAFTPEIMKEVDRIVDCYQRGQRAFPIGSASLKDEPKSFKKIAEGKTRIFIGEPAAFCFVVRKYLLPVVRLIQKNQRLFEAAPGVRAQSNEWGRLRQWITEFGENRMIAGDYANFDKRMPPIAVLGSFKVIEAICKEAGWSEEDLLVVKCIAHDTAYPVVDINGDFIQFFGSNPSGHPLTVIVNCFVGSLYMRYAFSTITNQPLSLFKLHVALMNYGDDNAMSSNVDDFNHTSIQKCLAEVGVGYTMADKEAASVPFIHIDDVSFLKRKFRYDDDVGDYVAPLEEESIEKMLTVSVKSKSITPEAQAIAIISTALREYFFYGKEMFEEKRKLFSSVVSDSTLENYLDDSTIPSWNELFEQFKKNSFVEESKDKLELGSIWGPETKPKHNRVDQLLREAREDYLHLEDGVNTWSKNLKFFGKSTGSKILKESQKTIIFEQLPALKVEHVQRVKCPTLKNQRDLEKLRTQQRDLERKYKNFQIREESSDLQRFHILPKNNDKTIGFLAKKSGFLVVGPAGEKLYSHGNFDIHLTYLNFKFIKHQEECDAYCIYFNAFEKPLSFVLGKEDSFTIIDNDGNFLFSTFNATREVGYWTLETQDEEESNFSGPCNHNIEDMFLKYFELRNTEARNFLCPRIFNGQLIVQKYKLLRYFEWLHNKRTIQRSLWREESADTAEGGMLSNTTGGIDNPKPAQLTQTVVEFLDENEGFETGFAANSNAADVADKLPNSTLEEFLSRPVRIATINWAESDPVTTNSFIFPWQLFFNDDRIKFKLNNYSYLRCNLKVKILINASPFYYGAMMVGYLPMPTLKGTTVTADAAGAFLVPFSQRPHIWLYPQNSEGGVMTLPFFWNQNWLSIPTASDFSDMGLLNFTVYDILKSANGVTGTGVTIQVYAWAENVELSGPTVTYALQSRDEYGVGPVSSVASALASASGALAKIPLIGKFATATQMGFNAVSSIASFLGFCNTPVIEDVMPLKPLAFPPMSTSDIGYPVEKLTLDAKNELSVDPGIAGLKAVDELNVSYLCQKESYLCSIPWSTSDVTDDILYYHSIHPLQYRQALVPTRYYTTPMAHVATLFTHWRGSIIVRYKFLASPYHKGRARLTWDPTGTTAQNLVNVVASQPVTFTKIIDLGKDSDVEFHIPYNQALGFSEVSQMGFLGVPIQITKTPIFTNPRGYANGVVTLRVVTPLTAPVLAAPITVLVSVRAGPDLELANPREIPPTFSYFAQQSEDMYDMGDSVSVGAGPLVPKEAKEKYLVYFGEAVQSLRQLMRRSTLSSVEIVNGASDNNLLQYDIVARWPLVPGFDPAGHNSAFGVTVPASNFPYNYVFFHPYSWVSNMFIGTRGSMMLHINYANYYNVNSIRIIRRPSISNTSTGRTSVAAGSITNNAMQRFYVNNSTSGAAGQALTTQKTQAGISALLPNYCNYKFQSTSINRPTAPVEADGSDNDCFRIEAAIDGVAQGATAYRVWKYFSIGTDLNLLFFINTPTVFDYGLIPLPN